MRLSRLTRIPRTLRNIARGREIIAIIAGFGFDDLLDRTGLAPRYARVRRFFRLSAGRRVVVTPGGRAPGVCPSRPGPGATF